MKRNLDYPIGYSDESGRLYDPGSIAVATLALSAASAGYGVMEQKKARKAQESAEMQARKMQAEKKPLEESAKLEFPALDNQGTNPFDGLLIEPTKKKGVGLGSTGFTGLGIGV